MLRGQAFSGEATSITGLITQGTNVTITGNGTAGNPYVINASGGGGGGGTVTSVSVVTANGFAGSVATATTTPAITISTSITGLLKGNGTAVSAAVAGTDYQAPVTLTTTGTSGAATFISNTLNIPQYQAAGNYITALTGDGTASGPGSAALTLATVNSNVGTFTNATITVNAKGLITAASNGTTAVTSVTGTTNRITVTGTTTAVIDIAATYVGQTSITTLGTIGTGVWQGTSISTTFTDAKIKTVTGTANRITIGGTATDPTFDISTSYVGQATITTLGTITTGTWNGTAIGPTFGGTGQTTYTLGDTLYSSATNTLSKLAGNTTTAKQYLSQTGNGTISAAPVWATIAGGDITGAALTKTDDTNVTLTLGGTPTTALLRATSLTLGWTGTLAVTRGGTGQSSYTNGQLLIGNTTGNTLTPATLTGTTNQVVVTNGTGSITLSTPQDIATASSPTFAGLTISGFTPGSVIFAGTGGLLSQDNANFFWDDANNFLGIGTASPAARLHLAGAQSAAAWGLNGIRLRAANASYTDTSSSGTVTNVVVDGYGTPTLIASSSTTYTNAATLYVSAQPTAGANVTITNSMGFWVDSGDSRLDGKVTIGDNTLSNCLLNIGGTLAISAPAWGVQGVTLRMRAGTHTDTSSSGTVASAVMNSFAASNIAASSVTTYTAVANVYIAAPPGAGTNVTLTNAYSLWIASGRTRFDGGQVVATRVVTAAGAITVTTADYYIGVNKTVGAATAVNLPATPATGTVFIIKDEKGDALTNNITITPAAGNIDNAATKVLNANLQSVMIIYNGTQWTVN